MHRLGHISLRDTFGQIAHILIKIGLIGQRGAHQLHFHTHPEPFGHNRAIGELVCADIGIKRIVRLHTGDAEAVCMPSVKAGRFIKGDPEQLIAF